MLKHTRRYDRAVALFSATAFVISMGLFLSTASNSKVNESVKTQVKPKAKVAAKAHPKSKEKIAVHAHRHKKVSRSKVRSKTYIPPANGKPRPVNGQRKCESWEDWTTPCGKNQRIGYTQASARGWDGRQWVCLKKLWFHESGWSKNSGSPDGGSFGIPQALPGSKMASAGPDWRTNAATQIKWGLGYIDGRYGSPCSAFAHWQSHNWY